MRAIAFLIGALCASVAYAQGNPGPIMTPEAQYLLTPPTYTNKDFAPLLVDQHGNLLTSATFSGSIGAVNTALATTSTLPTLTTGVHDFQGSLAGALYVQPVFASASGGGTIVDATHPLPVTSVSAATFSTTFPAGGQAAGVRDPNGNMNWLSIDATGAAIIGASTANPVNVNVIGGAGGGNTSSAFGATYPTSGVASGAKDQSGKLAALGLDANGALLVSVVAGGAAGGETSSAFGTAFPPAGEAAGFRDPNGIMRSGTVDLAGLFQVGNPVWTIIGPGAGTSAQRIAFSNDAADNTVTLAQNPTTVIGTVNQGAPAVTANQWPTTLYTGLNQLAINPSGQISCSNCSGSNSGPSMDMVAGPTSLSSAGLATLAVGTQGTGATTIVLASSSSLTANFEGLTPAGWSPVAMDNTTTGQTQSSATTNGVWQTNSAGYSQIRVNVQAGSTTASMESSAGSIPTGLDSAVYIASPATLTDGTPGPMTMTNDSRIRVSLATVAPTSRSGSIATGGVSQTLAASNANRRRFVLQNPCTASSQGISTAENLFYSYTGAASASGDSYELLPCSSFDSSSGPVAAAAITVFAATSGHKYKADELQ